MFFCLFVVVVVVVVFVLYVATVGCQLSGLQLSRTRDVHIMLV